MKRISRKTKNIEKAKQARVQAKPDQTELNTLWCLYLGAQSIDRISNGIHMPISRTKEIMEKLETKQLVERKSLMGYYKLTENGLRQIEPRRAVLDTKLTSCNIKHGQETDLWVFAKNSGGSPMSNALIRVVVPKFVEVRRYGSNNFTEDDNNILEFPLAQMHPGEAQHVNFKVKGFLTSGALSSKYKIQLQALIDEKETDRKDLNITVSG